MKETGNFWRTNATIGKTVVFFDADLTHVIEIRVGHRVFMEEKAEEYLDKHPRLKEAAEKVLAARNQRLDEWRRESLRWHYSADCGCFRVRVAGRNVDIGNGWGDLFAAPIYVVEDGEIPGLFNFVVSIAGEVEVMDYDMDGFARVLGTVHNPRIYVSGGEIAIQESRP